MTITKIEKEISNAVAYAWMYDVFKSFHCENDERGKTILVKKGDLDTEEKEKIYEVVMKKLIADCEFSRRSDVDYYSVESLMVAIID